MAVFGQSRTMAPVRRSRFPFLSIQKQARRNARFEDPPTLDQYQSPMDEAGTVTHSGPENGPTKGSEAGVINKHPRVAIVDDNESVRESLPGLLQHVGFAVQAFASAEEFLASEAADEASCLILDVGLPGMSGPDLQQELIRRRKAIPIVFITAQRDTSLHPRLVAAGAVACLFKPFSDTVLLEAVETALGRGNA